MNIGFIKAIPRLAASTQHVELDRAGVDRLWDAGKGESLTECIESLRSGDVLAVHKLPVLSVQPTSGKRERPRDRLRHYLSVLASIGVEIWETSTDRRFLPDDDAIQAILDAVDHWSGNSGDSSPGRPAIHKYAPDQWKMIEGIWFDTEPPIARRVGAVCRYEDETGSKPFSRFTYAEWNKHQKTKEPSDG